MSPILRLNVYTEDCQDAGHHFASVLADGIAYHQYQYASVNLKDSYQRRKHGGRGLINQQEYAKDQSYALGGRLKEHWKQS